MSKKHTYEFVKEHIESFGYKLLSDTYKNAHGKLEFQCSKGHEFSMKFTSFKNNAQRCPECFGTPKHTYEFVKEHIESFGYKLLSKEYVSIKYKLKLECPEGHVIEMRFGNFKNVNSRCNICAGHEKHTYEYIKERFEEEGYTLLSKKYKNNKTPLKTICPEGHNHSIPYGRFRGGDRCMVCSIESSSSKTEQEIYGFVKQIYDGDVISNDRTQIVNPETGCGLELDIWLPELNKAIEFNGVYWHSFCDVKRKDKIKKQQCKEKEISLMLIHEQDWINNKENCLNKIKEFVDVESTKEVKEI
jgi:hypothetical protein